MAQRGEAPVAIRVSTLALSPFDAFVPAVRSAVEVWRFGDLGEWMEARHKASGIGEYERLEQLKGKLSDEGVRASQVSSRRPFRASDC